MLHSVQKSVKNALSLYKNKHFLNIPKLYCKRKYKEMCHLPLQVFNEKDLVGEKHFG